MIPRWVRIAVYAVCLAHTLGGSAWAETYRIGALAFRGADHALKSWAPTAEALSHAIDGAKFEIVPLPLAALRRSVAENDVAFVFTNSGQYVALESEYGISRIVTLKTTFGRKIRNVFGAVIFNSPVTHHRHGLSQHPLYFLRTHSRASFCAAEMSTRLMIK